MPTCAVRRRRPTARSSGCARCRRWAAARASRRRSGSPSGTRRWASTSCSRPATRRCCAPSARARDASRGPPLPSPDFATHSARLRMCPQVRSDRREVPMSQNSFDARGTLEAGGRSWEIYRLDALQERFDVARLPFSLKVLLENLLRTEGNGSVQAQDIEALASWDAKAQPSKEISFTPARVLMQDFTGVPAVVDLAAMRDAIATMGGDAAQINPLVPAELVIDHSVQVDAFGTRDAFRVNAEREFERNQERYSFLRWGQGAFADFAVV